jgi:hypothetical protein
MTSTDDSPGPRSNSSVMKDSLTDLTSGCVVSRYYEPVWTEVFLSTTLGVLRHPAEAKQGVTLKKQLARAAVAVALPTIGILGFAAPAVASSWGGSMIHAEWSCAGSEASVSWEVSLTNNSGTDTVTWPGGSSSARSGSFMVDHSGSVMVTETNVLAKKTLTSSSVVYVNLAKCMPTTTTTMPVTTTTVPITTTTAPPPPSTLPPKVTTTVPRGVVTTTTAAPTVVPTTSTPIPELPAPRVHLAVSAATTPAASGALAFTGANSLPEAAGGAVLIAGGAALVRLARRKR